MNAKNAMLSRIRNALQDVTEQDPAIDVPIHWQYGKPLPTLDVVTEFVERVREHGATVVRILPHQLLDSLKGALEALGADQVVLPQGLPKTWALAAEHSGVQVWGDDPQLTHESLNLIDTVITICAVVMADSGTIALDHSAGQGRRALTLLPDKHLCVVQATQVVSDVPEGVKFLAPALKARRPITWISGGSATSDIELQRVEGVHGPRRLYVLVIDDSESFDAETPTS